MWVCCWGGGWEWDCYLRGRDGDGGGMWCVVCGSVWRRGGSCGRGWGVLGWERMGRDGAA